MRIALARVIALMLAASCASNPVRQPAALPGSDLTLLRHLLADIDSVDHITVSDSIPIYFDYWPAGARARNHPPDTVTIRERISTILEMGKDTASRSQWGGCPGILLPGSSREACPDKAMVIIAISDTLTLVPGMGGNVDSPQLAVYVSHTYLSRLGRREFGSYYSVVRSGQGWRTVRRYLSSESS
jgi:hypothetical protein